MSYKRYKDTLLSLVGKNDFEKLNEFSLNVLLKITQFVKGMSFDNLNDNEVSRITELISMVESKAVDWSKAGLLLDELTKISEDDEMHALDVDTEFVEFLCALDNWRIFAMTRDKNAVASVSENLMNILDLYYTRDESLENWLSVPQISKEFNEQIGFLGENA